MNTPPIHWLDDIDSTNEEAKRRAAASGFQDQWIAARSQTAGRGRLGRSWQSPTGNLFASALFHWKRPLAEAVCVPFVAALAVADTAEQFAPGCGAKLKWPNDVRVNGAKLSGILVESGEGPSGRWLVVGIGMNVASVPENIDQAGTCLSDLRGQILSVDLVLDTLVECFSERLQQAENAFDFTRRDWLARGEGLNEEVRVMVDGSPVIGVFEGLGPDGALLLRLQNGELHTIRAGDVELIREGH
ncbi:MAG: biotin--[acetyl-CoA-carboxylase] ligase [Pseudomonadota bacterium]